MTIRQRDAALAARLDEYEATLPPERQAQLLAAMEARRDALAPPIAGLFAPPRQWAGFAGAALCTVLLGVRLGGDAAQGLSASFAGLGLFTRRGG